LKIDLAAEAIAEIAGIWKIEQHRTNETKDGFDWWPGDHRVSVYATRRIDGHVPETWMLSVRTDFLKDIPIENERFVQFASLSAGVFGVTFAWVFHPAEIWHHVGRPGGTPRLWLANTVYLTAENASWLPRFLAEMSILQPVQARGAKETSELIFGGIPDTSRPRIFSRAPRADVPGETMANYIANGSAPNRWIGTGEFEEMADEQRGLDNCIVNGDPDGFTVQLNVGRQPAMIRLSTNETHPQLGNGLHCNLKLPIFDRSKTIAERCAGWNLRETLWTDIPQFGSWFPYSLPDDHACPQFTLFIPNALYGRGIATLAVTWLMQRFQLVFNGQFPN
jgi:hypothetical protein